MKCGEKRQEKIAAELHGAAEFNVPHGFFMVVADIFHTDTQILHKGGHYIKKIMCPAGGYQFFMQAGKKRHPDFSLQLLQVLTDAGLGQAQLICRRYYASGAVDMIEHFEAVEVW